MAFIAEDIEAGIIENASGNLPDGITTFCVVNTGGCNIVIVFTNGSEFYLEPGENFEGGSINQPYAGFSIDAMGSEVKYAYTQ